MPICCRNIDLLFLSLRELNFSFSLCVWRLLWAFYLNSHFISFHVFSFHWQTRDGRPCAAAPLPQMSKTFCFALFFLFVGFLNELFRSFQTKKMFRSSFVLVHSLPSSIIEYRYSKWRSMATICTQVLYVLNSRIHNSIENVGFVEPI